MTAATKPETKPAESPTISEAAEAAKAVKAPSQSAIEKATVQTASGRSALVVHLEGTRARAEINPRALASHLARGFVLGEPPVEAPKN